jgi:Flp pilus assembly protein TadG
MKDSPTPLFPVSSKRRRQRGNVLIEFATVAPFLMTMLAGAFTIGMSLNRSIQASNVCRNANVLMVRNVDLSKSENQRMLIRTATGLGMNIAGTDTPNPTGKGSIILTKVVRVGNTYCAIGIPGWNGQASTCPNHSKYAIAQRIIIANTSRWTSVVGTPGVTLLSNGEVPDADVAQSSAVVTTAFPQTSAGSGLIFLNNDEFTYICEVFVDVSELNMLPWLAAPNVNVRNIS